MAATPRPVFCSSRTSPDIPRTFRRASSSTRQRLPATCWKSIVGRLDPPFRLAKFEGDAAFLYVEEGRVDASLLLDAIEASYLAFRRRLRSIDQATSCDCNSCSLAPGLDLKLFVHHGSYVRTRIAGRDELAGPDVIIVHRLLKGAGAAAARASGFVLFTAAAVQALRLEPASLSSRGSAGVDRASRSGLDVQARSRESLARRKSAPPPRLRARPHDPRHRGHVRRGAFGGLGPPNFAVASNTVGGAACYRGNLA